MLAGTPIVSNTTTLGVIAVAGTSNSYEFTANQGDRIILSVGEGALATPTFDPALTLTGTTGTVLKTDAGTVSAYVEVAAPTTGTYTVTVSELNNNTTGDYRLHFDKAPNPGLATDPADGDGKVLTPNSTTTAAIGTVGDIDLYSFTAAVGDRIILSMGEGAAATPTFDPYLALYSPTGTQVTSDATVTSAYIEVTATTAGTYSVLARENNDDTTGDYRLHFEQLPFAGNATDPADGDGRTLASNVSVGGAIGTIGDLDLYTFTANQGDRIILSIGEGSAATATFDPYMELLSPTGAVLTSDARVSSAYIEVTAATSGTFGVLVRELNNNTTGDYRIYFDKAPHTGAATDPADGDGKVLTPNSTTSAAIGSVGDLDLYTFSAAAGDRIVLSMGEGSAATATFDPYLALYGPAGNQITTDAGVASAYIEVTATVAGTYTVLALENNNDTTGDYKLYFEKAPFAGNATDPADGDGKTLAPNSTTTAAIGAVGDLDLYTFTAAAGDRIVLSMGEGSAATATFDPYLELFNPSGGVVQTSAGVASAFIEVTAATAGTYTVLARENNDDTTGDYRLYFEKLPFTGNATDPADNQGKSLISDTTTTAAIGAVGDLDLYTFTAAVGDHVVLSMGEGAAATATFDPSMTLYGPTGAVLDSNAGPVSAFVEFTATTAGTYGVLIRENNDDTTGDYRLHFVKVPFAGNPQDPADGDGQALSSNQAVSAAIGTIGDLDLYTFTAALGDSFILTAGDTSGTAFTPYLAVYLPNGTMTAFDAGAAGASVSLLKVTTAGTYCVLVRDNTDTLAGNYALHFVKIPGPQPVDPADQDGGALVSGQSTSASITVGDLDAYTFTLAAGGSAVIRANEIGSTAFAPLLDVFGPTGALVGSNTGAASAIVTLTNVTAAGTYTIIVHDSGDDAVGQYALAIDATPAADTRVPTVIASRFDYNSDRQQIVYTLSEGIAGTLEATDLVLLDRTHNTPVSPDFVSATFNPLSNEVTFRFPGFLAGALPDGDYRATLTAGSLSDGSGNGVAASPAVDFFTFAGDANHDRTVDFNDLVLLAQNYNTPGKRFSTGDFNYDGICDFNDLVLLAQRYNTSLPAPVVAGAAVGAGSVASAASTDDFATAFATAQTAPSAPVVPDSASGPAKKKVNPIFSVTPIAKPAPVKAKAPPKRR